MAREENILGCSYSGGAGGGGGGGGGRGGGGGGCSGGVGCSRSKKIKQKKVPQRGLGVAQLEKIRLEEQQKRESLQAANILAKNAVGSPNDSNPFLGVQKFRPSFSPFHNSVPLPPPSSSSDLPSPFRHIQSVPNIEIMQENSVQVSRQSNASGGEIDSRAISSPRLWGGEYNLVREKLRLDHQGFAFDPQVNLSYEDTPVLPLPMVSQRSPHFHQTSSSSMLQVNPSSGISPSSVVSSQMEPPSNQSFRSNNHAPLWTEEDKMVGMKRSYPFSLESPPAPSLHCNFHPMCAASSSKSDDLALCSNGYTDRMDSRTKCIRGGPSSSSPLPERKPSEATIDDGRLNGDFLTLAPPSVASPPLNVTHKHPFGYSGYQGHEYKCRPSQEYAKSQIHQPGSSGSVEQPFSFFPIKLQSNQTTNDVSNGNEGKGETIDLNLKL